MKKSEKKLCNNCGHADEWHSFMTEKCNKSIKADKAYFICDCDGFD